MTSNSSSGASNSNSRFTSQQKTAEDLLSTQTVGLVKLSDFRKRRAEVLEQKDRDAEALRARGNNSGRATPTGTASDGSVTPRETQRENKKAKKGKQGPKLSFEVDEEKYEEELDTSGSTGASTPKTREDGSASPNPTNNSKRKFAANSSVAVAPKALTKSALLREAQTREMLRKEFLTIQEAVRATELCIPFVFYDGTNIPGGVCRVKKGDFIWVFLDRSRKLGADLGVGEKANSRREWARIGVDDLMLVRGTVIIPHHYDFYYFIINQTMGASGTPLFDYSAEPPQELAPIPSADAPIPENYNPLSRPTKAAPTKSMVENTALEGVNDDPTNTKVVDRRWYERNKHIYPASVWQQFDPKKDYQTEIRRDLGGNAFFFS